MVVAIAMTLIALDETFGEGRLADRRHLAALVGAGALRSGPLCGRFISHCFSFEVIAFMK